ncbi:ketoacyl-ACP synthase III [Oscillochloris sp. ZM17-4]|uniref:3-oxoacyl-ACP synthase III family protein n=1 Tax=Oscillochloris sp. ZM17-4 TaxID=2866714 RepID=UPI001C73DDA3|nr:ketoacyl-ACP synthase III [Oscillochloris sp. ZM17-4]MBX0331340.1 ketoacyl-ACP synthase III [Oscillochloris sp. ZM17-4]
MNTIITAMHYCVPKGRMTNADLAERFGERQLKAITKMAGIEERRIVAPGETASDLAYWAARRLLDDRRIDPQRIDLLIFASQTGDHQIPATACSLHGRLGLADTCAAFDINLGCSSYPYSLAVAHGMITAGVAHRALVLNADALSPVIHPLDRGLVPLHGDGAVATLLEASASGGGFRGFRLGTDGSGAQHIMIPASGARIPRSEATRREITDESGIVRTQEHLYMNGPAVFHFSVYKIPEVIRQALDQFQLTVDDLDLVLLHQANKTMVDMIYRVLEVPESKRFYYMESVGNLASASTPLVLAEAWRQGRLHPGQRILLASFGNGLSWGVAVIEWPEEAGPPVQGPVEPGEAE